jgi:hypothetical protein
VANRSKKTKNRKGNGFSKEKPADGTPKRPPADYHLRALSGKDQSNV